jgi:hypothetical protein
MAHNLLVILAHGLMEGTCSAASRSDRQEARQEEDAQQRALAALERLGSRGTLSPVA